MFGQLNSLVILRQYKFLVGLGKDHISDEIGALTMFNC